jgi:hypothetical protein
MKELLDHAPWLIPASLALLIPLCGIIFGTVTGYLRKSRQAELDAALKHEMIQRGMSADEIVKVLQAQSRPAKKGCRDRQPLHELAEKTGRDNF